MISQFDRFLIYLKFRSFNKKEGKMKVARNWLESLKPLNTRQIVGIVCIICGVIFFFSPGPTTPGVDVPTPWVAMATTLVFIVATFCVKLLMILNNKLFKFVNYISLISFALIVLYVIFNYVTPSGADYHLLTDIMGPIFVLGFPIVDFLDLRSDFDRK